MNNFTKRMRTDSVLMDFFYFLFRFHWFNISFVIFFLFLLQSFWIRLFGMQMAPQNSTMIHETNGTLVANEILIRYSPISSATTTTATTAITMAQSNQNDCCDSADSADDYDGVVRRRKKSIHSISDVDTQVNSISSYTHVYDARTHSHSALTTTTATHTPRKKPKNRNKLLWNGSNNNQNCWWWEWGRAQWRWRWVVSNKSVFD